MRADCGPERRMRVGPSAETRTPSGSSRRRVHLLCGHVRDQRPCYLLRWSPVPVVRHGRQRRPGTVSFACRCGSRPRMVTRQTESGAGGVPPAACQSCTVGAPSGSCTGNVILMLGVPLALGSYWVCSCSSPALWCSSCTSAMEVLRAPNSAAPGLSPTGRCRLLPTCGERRSKRSCPRRQRRRR